MDAARELLQILDGCETTPNTQALESARYLDEQFIRNGMLGVASGQGFYRYPNPAFDQPGFI